MDWKDLTYQIYRASKAAFSGLLQHNPTEDFYAFALYSDSGAMSVVPAANARQGLQLDPDPQTQAYYRWSTAEWQYEGCAGWSDDFRPICSRLASDVLSGGADSFDFPLFRESLWEAMILALRQLDNEGFFGVGARREQVTLFVSISDDDDAEALEDRSAQLLNPPQVAQAFLSRYAGI